MNDKIVVLSINWENGVARAEVGTQRPKRVLGTGIVSSDQDGNAGFERFLQLAIARAFEDARERASSPHKPTA